MPFFGKKKSKESIKEPEPEKEVEIKCQICFSKLSIPESKTKLKIKCGKCGVLLEIKGKVGKPIADSSYKKPKAESTIGKMLKKSESAEKNKAKEEPRIIDLELSKNENPHGYLFNFEPSEDKEYILITKFREGPNKEKGQLELDGRIFKNDRILEINGKTTKGIDSKKALSRIKKNKTVSFKIQLMTPEKENSISSSIEEEEKERKRKLKEIKEKAQSKVFKAKDAKDYKAGGGNVKIETQKLDFKEKAQSKVPKAKDAKDYKAGGGNVKIETQKLDFKEKAQSKVPKAKDAKDYKAGGGNVKIETQKLDFRERAESKVAKEIASTSEDEQPSPAPEEVQEPERTDSGSGLGGWLKRKFSRKDLHDVKNSDKDKDKEKKGKKKDKDKDKDKHKRTQSSSSVKKSHSRTSSTTSVKSKK